MMMALRTTSWPKTEILNKINSPSHVDDENLSAMKVVNRVEEIVLGVPADR